MTKNSQIFFQEIKTFQTTLQSSIEKGKEGQKLTSEFIKLINQTIQSKEIPTSNSLYSHIEQINSTLSSFIKSIEKEWTNFTLSEELSKDFGDKLIFFVFGKVNAGKSSFSNLFSEFSGFNSKIHYLDENNKIQTNQHNIFQVGQTETTARIQWIELEGLILVDSPGLHSITAKNAELTKKYLDSADAIIWLTSSGSPGQVQELEALAKEMRKEKPILPIITKSDDKEEDWCDKTNNIVKVLKPKDSTTRNLQENDVKKRAEEVLSKLNSKAKLLQPISISAQCAKEGMVAESNIEMLFETLNSNILKKAINYKSEKPKKLLVKYFELEIIEKVNKNLVPKIDTLKLQIQKQRKTLKQKQKCLETTLLRDINLKISFLVEKHESSKNTKELTNELNEYITQKFDEKITKILSKLFKDIQNTSIHLNSSNVAEYKNIEYHYTIRGKERSLWDKVSEWDWRDRESNSRRTEVIGIDSSAVVDSLTENTSQEINKNLEIIFSEFDLTFEDILSNITKMEEDIKKFIIKIEELKNDK